MAFISLKSWQIAIIGTCRQYRASAAIITMRVCAPCILAITVATIRGWYLFCSEAASNQRNMVTHLKSTIATASFMTLSPNTRE